MVEQIGLADATAKLNIVQWASNQEKQRYDLTGYSIASICSNHSA